MDFDQNCLDFLDHFDRPKTVDAAEFESPAWVEFDASSITRDDDAAHAPLQLPARGVRWVLQWAAAIAVLVVAASVLAQYACLVAAEHALYVAAKAGAMEATLPRASYQSVTAVVEHRLAGYPQLTGRLQISLLQNGLPVGQRVRPGEGDRFSIALTAPASAMAPSWLRKLSFWRGDTSLNAHAERQVPGRKLQPLVFGAGLPTSPSL